MKTTIGTIFYSRYENIVFYVFKIEKSSSTVYYFYINKNNIKEIISRTFPEIEFWENNIKEFEFVYP